jgi:hypothetical protein
MRTDPYLSELRLRNVRQLDLLHSDSFARGPIERPVHLTERALAERVTELLESIQILFEYASCILT